MESTILEMLQQYLIEDAMFMVPVLLVVGWALKKTPQVADWLIPWALLALGILGGLLVVELSAAGVIQGVIAAGVAVFLHQVWKQTKEHGQDQAA